MYIDIHTYNTHAGRTDLEALYDKHIQSVLMMIKQRTGYLGEEGADAVDVEGHGEGRLQFCVLMWWCGGVISWFGVVFVGGYDRFHPPKNNTTPRTPSFDQKRTTHHPVVLCPDGHGEEAQQDDHLPGVVLHGQEERLFCVVVVGWLS